MVVPGTEVTAVYDINPDGRTGTLSGSGGCNTYNAQITDVFKLGLINATASLCEIPAGVMEQEAAYLNALETANGISQEGSTLRITTALETIIFTNIGPAPVLPLPTPDSTSTPEVSLPLATPEPTSAPEVSLPLPIVAIINAPIEGVENQAITFDGSLSSSNVEISSYSWTFGDATVSIDAIAEHTYFATGVYDVVLTVTDVNGQSADTSMVITIQ